MLDAWRDVGCAKLATVAVTLPRYHRAAFGRNQTASCNSHSHLVLVLAAQREEYEYEYEYRLAEYGYRLAEYGYRLAEYGYRLAEYEYEYEKPSQLEDKFTTSATGRAPVHQRGIGPG